MAAPSTVEALAEKVVKDNHDDSDTTQKKACDVLETLAQAAETAERYDDMVVMMQKLVQIKIKASAPLSADQRNLLSVAYKNVVGAKRSSWRVLNENNSFQGEKADEKIPEKLIESYKAVVEKELDAICKQVLEELDKLQEQNAPRIPNKDGDSDKKIAASAASGDDGKAKPEECQVFYLKMIGDYYRYLTEAKMEEPEYKQKCQAYYQQAMTLAVKQLEATHPTRLGLALNFSVCYYEILDQPKKACELAKSAFDEAIEKLDSLNDVSYKDSTLIMQLLRDNLTIWNQTGAADKDDEPVS